MPSAKAPRNRSKLLMLGIKTDGASRSCTHLRRGNYALSHLCYAFCSANDDAQATTDGSGLMFIANNFSLHSVNAGFGNSGLATER